MKHKHTQEAYPKKAEALRKRWASVDTETRKALASEHARDRYAKLQPDERAEHARKMVKARWKRYYAAQKLAKKSQKKCSPAATPAITTSLLQRIAGLLS